VLTAGPNDIQLPLSGCNGWTLSLSSFTSVDLMGGVMFSDRFMGRVRQSHLSMALGLGQVVGPSRLVQLHPLNPARITSSNHTLTLPTIQ